MKRLFLLLCTSLLLTSCAGVEVARYQGEKPVLDLRKYFSGTIDGWGMFQDRSGAAIKRFHVKINAHWEGDTGTLDEDFTWSDGTRSKRVWTLTDLGSGRWRGRAADVVGVAEGEAVGSALRWRYVLALPVDDRVINVDMDDWMFMIDDEVMLNRTAMSKFGLHLGDITLSFRKRP
jgi:hypothetical protein